MYALFRKSVTSGVEHFEFVEQISLFGCNIGYIPRLLRAKITPTDTEPHKWHINIPEALMRDDKSGHAIIINLKPKNSSPNLSLFELADVWGVSSNGWTPIMMRLRALFVDANPSEYNGQDFERPTAEITDPILSMMYLWGSIANGRLVGRWTPPGASPTNSVLLWKDTFEYFAAEGKKAIDANT